MANLKLLKIIYHELKDDYCSVRYISDCSFLTPNYIWNQLRLLKAMGFLLEKFSDEKTNTKAFKLKHGYDTYEMFIDEYTDKL